MRLSAAGGALAAVLLAGCTASTSGSPDATTSGGSYAPLSALSSSPSAALPPSTFAPAPGSASGSASSSTPPTEPAFTDPAAAETVLAAARRDLTAVNSYDYRTLAGDRSRALAATTGALTGRIDTAYRDEIGRYAPSRKAVQQADFEHIGLESVQGDQAAVLAVGTLHDTSATTAARSAPATAAAQLRLVGGTWLLSALSTTPTMSLPPPGTTALIVAFAAARTAVPILSTFSAADFAHDYGSALVVTTGSVHRGLVKDRSALERAVVGRHEKLSAELTGLAVEKIQPHAVTVVATENTYRSTGGSRGTPNPERLEVTLVPVSGNWLIADLSVLG